MQKVTISPDASQFRQGRLETIGLGNEIPDKVRNGSHGEEKKEDPKDLSEECSTWLSRPAALIK